MDTLRERRAEFVYNAARLAATAALAPVIPVQWSEREQAFREQCLAVIERQCGSQRSTSPEELHGSWMQSYLTMGWVYGEVYDREKKTHPDLVPYAELGQLERDKDAVFIALCEIAKQFIYDQPSPLKGKKEIELEVLEGLRARRIDLAAGIRKLEDYLNNPPRIRCCHKCGSTRIVLKNLEGCYCSECGTSESDE